MYGSWVRIPAGSLKAPQRALFCFKIFWKSACFKIFESFLIKVTYRIRLPFRLPIWFSKLGNRISENSLCDVVLRKSMRRLREVPAGNIWSLKNVKDEKQSTKVRKATDPTSSVRRHIEKFELMVQRAMHSDNTLRHWRKLKRHVSAFIKFQYKTSVNTPVGYLLGETDKADLFKNPVMLEQVEIEHFTWHLVSTFKNCDFRSIALNLLTKVLRRFECFNITRINKKPCKWSICRAFCWFLKCYSVLPTRQKSNHLLGDLRKLAALFETLKSETKQNSIRNPLPEK